MYHNILQSFCHNDINDDITINIFYYMRKMIWPKIEYEWNISLTACCTVSRVHLFKNLDWLYILYSSQSLFIPFIVGTTITLGIFLSGICVLCMFLGSVSRDGSLCPSPELLASLQSLGENSDYTLLPHCLHQVCVSVCVGVTFFVLPNPEGMCVFI